MFLIYILICFLVSPDRTDQLAIAEESRARDDLIRSDLQSSQSDRIALVMMMMHQLQRLLGHRLLLRHQPALRRGLAAQGVKHGLPMEAEVLLILYFYPLNLAKQIVCLKI